MPQRNIGLDIHVALHNISPVQRAAMALAHQVNGTQAARFWASDQAEAALRRW
jgi:hypothetical protein